MVTRPHFLLAAGVLAGLAFASGGPAMGVEPCTGAQLTGTFKLIPGSAGAGGISYRLRVTNRSQKACIVSGVAGLRFLSKTGKPLPTRVTRAQSGLGLARITLQPGKSAKADARFSPDIPDQNEPQTGPCEPVAYKVRVTPPPGGGTLVAPVSPPTTVCVHGHVQLKNFSAAS